MATNGIEGLLVETHNWGKTVAFWKSLGYALEFETDHHSGILKHPSGGPYLFVAERPESHALQMVPVIAVPDPAKFEAPASGTVVRPFERQHWPVLEMLLADPDGRTLSVQTPAHEAGGAHHHG